VSATLRLRRAAAAILVAATTAGCGLQPDPPPQFPSEAFSGEGDRMAECMQYRSQSYCEQEIWGGGER